MNFLSSLSVVWPSLIMGAIIPCGVLLALYLMPKRKEVAFNAVLYGFATFFMALVAVAVVLLLVVQLFLPTIAVSDVTDADVYIYVGGSLALLLFYLIAETVKYFTFQSALKQESNRMAGLTFGSGFILGQNLLVFGLVFATEIDMMQAVGFGVLMLISGVIYILLSAIGYQLTVEKHRIVGSVLAITYYMVFAVMLLFANVYITYSFVVAVLVFNLIMGYVLLPLPFKKNKGGASR